MNTRVKELRKSFGLSQEEFGERLGIGKAAVSAIENGKSNLSGANRRSILREFNVNPEWLDTGNGDMFLEHTEEDDLAEFFGDVLVSDDIRKRICKVLAKMPHEYWGMIADLAEQIADEAEAEKDIKKLIAE